MSLLEKIDTTIMSGVEAGVYAWNWATGRTKTDLANFLSVAGSTALLVGAYQRSLAEGLAYTPLTTIWTLMHIKTNNRQQRLEEINRNKEAIDLKIFNHNYINKSAGYALSTLGILGAKFSLMGIGSLLWGASHFVMCADNYPPRKNCLSRGVEKLAETLKGYFECPQTEPTPIRG